MQCLGVDRNKQVRSTAKVSHTCNPQGMPSAPPPLPCNPFILRDTALQLHFLFHREIGNSSYFCHRKMGRDRKFAWVSPSMQFVCPSTSTRIIHLWTYRAPIAPVTTSECDHGSQLLRASHPVHTHLNGSGFLLILFASLSL